MLDSYTYEETVIDIKSWIMQRSRWVKGHIITFFTSRVEEHRGVTEEWLKNNDFKYHGLLMGKPRGGNYHWIDNHIVRATRYEGKFSDLVETNASIQVFEK
jgi:cellulose synthase/poly-beta-1,6-N-acetylglucosamine synthase-like glycosyltransferase